MQLASDREIVPYYLPRNHTAHKHHWEIVRRRLQDGANSHNNRADDDRDLSAQSFTNGKRNQGSKEATHSVDGRYRSQDIRSTRTDQVMQNKEVLRYDDATEDCLIVTCRQPDHSSVKA
jgi:hypothetical protein